MPADAPIDESLIREGLLREYGVTAGPLVLLRGGLDHRAWTYRVAADGGAPLVLRLSLDEPRAGALVVPRHLVDAGLDAVVAPEPASNGDLAVRRDGLAWTVAPWIDGTDGYASRLAEGHWRELGAALRAVHETVVEGALLQVVPRDVVDVAAYAEQVGRWDTEVRRRASDAPAFGEAWSEHRAMILAMLAQMSRLAGVRTEQRPAVLCHGDLHPGNVLVDGAGGIHLIDWSEVRLAPRERDLLFVPGLPSVPGNSSGVGFLRGYGLEVDEVDWVALTHFRCERVIQDVVVEAELALGVDAPTERRKEAAGWLRHVLQAGGEADAAVAAASCLPADLDLLSGAR